MSTVEKAIDVSVKIAANFQPVPLRQAIGGAAAGGRSCGG